VTMDPILNVLIVEDDNHICDIIEEFLKPYFKKIFRAGSVDDASEICKKNHVELVITDILLPGQDGFDMVNWLNSFSRTIGIPIVMMTGARKDKEAIKEAKLLGVDKFVFKPFESDDLKQSVLEICGNNYRAAKLKRTIDSFKQKEDELEVNKKEQLRAIKNKIVEINKQQRTIQQKIQQFSERTKEEYKEKVLENAEKLKANAVKANDSITDLNKMAKDRYDQIQQIKRKLFLRMKDLQIEE
ncbi:MAG: response regulator, partial [bacterium]|nr:response regulator [bacterium]